MNVDKSSKSLILWVSVLFAFMAFIFISSILICQDPLRVDLGKVLLPPGNANMLGYDNLGRDMWTRILYGGRVTILVSILSMLLSTVVGILVGGVSGFFGGWIDKVLMKVVDIVLSIPMIIVAVCLKAYIKGGVFSLIIVIGLTGWYKAARIIRGAFTELREKEFVKSSFLFCTPWYKIFINNFLKNSVPEILLIIIWGISQAVFAEVSLSFLGIGIPEEIPSWGNMLTNAQNDILVGAWWTSVFPGSMIVLFILLVNFAGETLRKKYNL